MRALLVAVGRGGRLRRLGVWLLIGCCGCGCCGVGCWGACCRGGGACGCAAGGLEPEGGRSFPKRAKPAPDRGEGWTGGGGRCGSRGGAIGSGSGGGSAAARRIVACVVARSCGAVWCGSPGAACEPCATAAVVLAA